MSSGLEITVRQDKGKKAARKLRHEGFVPGVVYGGDKAPVLVSVSEKELSKVCYSSSFLNHICEAKLDGSKKERVLPRIITFNQTSGRPSHIDFQRVSKSSVLKIQVPIEFINEDKSPGIKKGGILNIIVHQLECSCSPDNIPENIIIDLSGKDVGNSCLLNEIKLPKGVEATHSDRDSIIATIVGAKVGASSSSEDSAGGDEAAPE